MRLAQLFEQRKIGPTHGSVASLIPLRRPSGPQWTESELETKLVEQLDFSLRVHDILTQTGIRYPDGENIRLYTPDIFIELFPDQSGSWSYYLIEAAEVEKWRAENHRKIEAARNWCQCNHAEFRIVTEREIETPYLRNARRLRNLVGRVPDMEILAAIESFISPGGSKASELIARLVNDGRPEPEVRDALDGSIANRLLTCDLSNPYDDGAIITHADPRGREYNDRDPIIKLLLLADSG